MKVLVAMGIIGFGTDLKEKDVALIPGGGLDYIAVLRGRDGQIWIQGEMAGQPQGNEFKEVKMDDKLAGEVDFSLDLKRGKLTGLAKKLLASFFEEAEKQLQ